MKQNKCPLKNSVARAGIGVLLLGMMSAVTTAQTPYYFRWAVNPQGVASVVDLAVDASGNAHLTGGYGYDRTALDFGTTILPTVTHGWGDAFVVKYDRSGNLQWARGVQTTETADGSLGAGIAMDASGNVYITGYFGGRANFDGTVLTNPIPDLDLFVAKYSSGGSLVWVRQGVPNAFGAAIAVDSAGNSYVIGSTWNTRASFGSLTVTQGVFLVKHDTLGNALWAWQPERLSGFIAFSPQERRGAVAAESDGTTYVTGSMQGQFRFGTTLLTTTNDGCFVAKYDANGNVLWARQAEGGTSEGLRVAADEAGNCYISGRFTGAILLGPINLTSSGYRDIFIAKYDAAGQVLWAKRAGSSSGDDFGYGVAANSEGQVYLTGRFERMADFDGTSLSAIGPDPLGWWYSEVFVASYGPSGNLLWVDRAGGIETDYGVDIGLDAAGSAYVAGQFWSTNATFGSVTITNNRSGVTFFLARLDPAPRLNVERAGAEVVLSWPADAADFTLQFANTLAPTPSWTNSTIAPGIVGDRARVTNQVSGTSRVYRLRHP